MLFVVPQKEQNIVDACYTLWVMVKYYNDGVEARPQIEHTVLTKSDAGCQDYYLDNDRFAV